MNQQAATPTTPPSVYIIATPAGVYHLTPAEYARYLTHRAHTKNFSVPTDTILGSLGLKPLTIPVAGIVGKTATSAILDDPLPAKTPLDQQIGGDHYKSMKIQPVEFISANNIPYLEGNVIKYVCRHGTKNGEADLDKAIHYLQLLKELRYGNR